MSRNLIGLRPDGSFRESDGAADLAELRRSSFSLVVGATIGLSVLVVLVPDPLLAGDIAPDGLVSLCLLTGALLGLLLRARSLSVASAALVAGLGISLGVAVFAFSPGSAIPWLSLLVLVGAALLGRRGGLAVGVASSLFVAVVLPKLGVATSPATVASGQALIWAAVALAWLITQPLYTALDWSWRAYRQAMERTDEAQRHRGELAGALKELGEVCRRLEDANHELDRARQAADEARRLRERFAAFVSHEIRLPLNIITGFSEMMVTSPVSYDGQALPDAYRADVEAIYRAAYQLSSLIDDVLDLTEIDAHQMGLEKEWISLGEVVETAAATAQGLFQSKGLRLALDVPSGLPPVHADAGRIRQVVLNLLKNAVRFTDFGEVRVSAAGRNGEVVVSVTDTGIGIPAADLGHVFDEFRQLEGAGQRRFGGSGLGLAICKRFVELHGGNIWVESRPGEGSTFAFSVPIHPTVAAVPLREPWESWARPRPSVGQHAVAVVGPDTRVTRLLQRYLDGYRVLVLGEPAGLSRLDPKDPVCAAIVVGTRDRDVASLARQTSALAPGIPVVGCAFQSGRGETLRALGVSGYLRKPVDRRAVTRALSAVPCLDRILVVDDDPDMLRLLASMVGASFPDARVWLADDGAEALSLIERHRPRAVLLDLVMPGLDGHEVIRRLRASGRLADTAVIAVTAGTGAVETLTGAISQVTRAGGLTAGELVRCLRATLDSLLEPPDHP